MGSQDDTGGSSHGGLSTGAQIRVWHAAPASPAGEDAGLP
jgi:hypothetical protein